MLPLVRYAAVGVRKLTDARVCVCVCRVCVSIARHGMLPRARADVRELTIFVIGRIGVDEALDAVGVDDLDEIDWADAPPADPDRGSGFVAADFEVGDNVLVWIHRDWWSGKVTYKSRAGTLSVRMVGSQNSMPGILPKHTKPAVDR